MTEVTEPRWPAWAAFFTAWLLPKTAADSRGIMHRT